MARTEKILTQILSRKSDANIRFNDVRQLLLSIGFEERTRGSHHIFRLVGIVDMINLQRDGDKAKPYQIKQVREVLLRNNLAGGED